MPGRTYGIGEYGLLGDTRTAALVAPDGGLDWLCLPRFDGDPVFGRLIGGDAAGFFTFGPEPAMTPASRRYRSDSAVLETCWRNGDAELVLTEAMVLDVTGELLPTSLLVRRLQATQGSWRVRVQLAARRGPEHYRPRARQLADGVTLSWRDLAISVRCSPSVPFARDGDIDATLDLPAGSSITVSMSAAHREPMIEVAPDTAWRELDRTDRQWRDWAASIDFAGTYAPAVRRSLVTLRLLTYAPSGAPVAAPTTSLPECIGGERNWDYRFAWPRDASVGVGAFLLTGRVDEARAFLYWLDFASHSHRRRLPPLLSLYGRRTGPERCIDWPGYRGSRPVRVGNQASGQHQLDTYGWVLDAAWNLVSAGHPLYRSSWRSLSRLADVVARTWRDPDAGIWEVRTEPRQWVHSKLMALLGLDRALRIAQTHPTRRARCERWRRERDLLADEVVAFGVEDGHFVREYGSPDLDAALLVVPTLGDIGTIARYAESTVRAVQRELGTDGGLVYRYRPGDDGLPGVEGAFLPASFWLVGALASLGHAGEADELFTTLLGYGGELGLFAEEIDPDTTDFLGNYPQALTHAAVVQAAAALRDAKKAPATARAARRTERALRS